MGSKSNLDRLYRTLLLSKFFVKGWGKVDHYEKLFNFRKVFISKPGKAAELVGNNYNVVLQKEEMSDHTITISGQFKSPFVDFLPGLLPEEAEIATFQLVIPKKWKTNIKPVCIHMAGTGDHYFWKRRTFMAKPLAREYGIGSIILENPYYGSRKPKYQTRSCLHNVSDIFVMGGCLALEAAVLLNWCKTQGFGPLGLSGISMGGYMASIAAGAWPEPVVLVPCLSWTTASTVFTKGVMSSAINWKLLDTQYKSVSDYREKFLSLLKSPEDASEKVFLVCENPKDSSVFCNQIEVEKAVEKRASVFSTGLLGWNFLSIPTFSIRKSESVIKHEKSYLEATNFMRGLMDEFTHLGNFCPPADLDMIIVVAANRDAYVPREGVKSLDEIWPGIEVRYVDTGHIGAYLKYHGLFKRAIFDAFENYRKKYLLNKSV
ncbi:protein ABHD18-like [Artemia franciscana]|uniref:Abhydrolase domain containing 18 n=1 Tax=Artemia franciscana TaxID=6661 RepID=A0AA88IXJ5_ARTSF|nr:hypothetical protein QYM36_008523 [Artemia franciscana]